MIVRNHCGRVASVALAIILMLGFSVSARADHLVDSGQVVNRLLTNAQTREQRIAVFEKALSSPVAEAKARSLGLDPSRLRAVVPQLSDAELKDIADRASRAQDISAGYYHEDEGMFFAFFLILLLAVIIIATARYY